MNNFEKYYPQHTDFYLPNKSAHRGLSIPEVLKEYGNLKGGLRSRLPVLGTMIKGIGHMKKGYKVLKSCSPSSGKTRIETQQLKDLESYAKSLGCLHVGYTQVPSSYIFSNKKILYRNAIVLTMEMNHEKMALAPTKTAGIEVWRTYERLGYFVNQVADYLRLAGFCAQAGSPMGGDVNYSLLAQKAGIGQIGKNGLLITPETGPSLRIAAVYTNIENLPYTDSDTHAWVQDFCSNCMRCQKKCPAGAIYKEDIIFDDKSRQCIDYTKCATPFSKHLGCSVCIRECTFFKGDYYKIQDRFNKKLLRPLVLR